MRARLSEEMSHGDLRSRVRTLLPAFILALCAAGAVVSLGLLQAHADPEHALLGRICSAAGADGCREVLDSRWARLSLPIPWPAGGFDVVARRINVPVAFLGAAYFTLLGAWFGLAGSAAADRAPCRWVPRAIAVAGGVASLCFVGVMAVTSAPWCFWCCVVHAINALLVPSVWCVSRGVRNDVSIVTSGRRDARPVLLSRDAIAAMIVAVVLIGGMWAHWRQARIHHSRVARLMPLAAMAEDLRGNAAFLLREFAAQPVVLSRDIPLRPTEQVTDDQSLLVVFSDFDCPACRCNAAVIRDRMQRTLGDRVRVLVRHYPLCASCNDHVQAKVSPNACTAAYAAEAVRLQGGEVAFSRMHDALFARIAAPGPDMYADLARTLGLDADRLLRDMAGAAVRRTVAADIELAASIGIRGTPTVLLDGRPLPAVCDTAAFWSAYVDEERREPGYGVLARPEPVLTPARCPNVIDVASETPSDTP